MLETLPPNFFNLLVSKNRDLYISSLFVLRKAIRQVLDLTRDEFVERLQIALDEKFKTSNLYEDDEQEQTEVKLENNSSKAYFIVRKLKEYGWINIDINTKNTFEESIAVPAYSSMAINFLYMLSEGAETEYNSLVYSVYSALKIADDEHNDYYTALQTAYKNTERLNESLSNLFYGIKSIEQRIAENININEVVRIHFNEYIEKLHDKFYHPYKTFDSIHRYRNPIMKILKSWQLDNGIRKKMLELAKSKLPDLDNNQLFEYITELYQYILQTYENIDDKMDIIDKKIFDYTTNSINKIKHLVNVDESYKGKLTYLINVLTKNRDKNDVLLEEIQNTFAIGSLELASNEGLYTKRDIQPTTISNMPEIDDTTTSEDIMEANELMKQLQQGISIAQIKEFIKSRVKDNSEINIENLNIENDNDLILTILAMLRSDEKELPFVVEYRDGYLKVNQYVVPNIKFIMKEGKR